MKFKSCFTYFFLKKGYRFRGNQSFFEEFELNQERYFNNTDYTVISKSTFQVKLSRPKRIAFFESAELENKTLQEPLGCIKIRFFIDPKIRKLN